MSMQVAAKAEYDTAEVTDDHVRDITVSTGGTWKTRVHSSKQGVVTTIGMNNGKVLDSQAKSKVRKSCDYWNKQDPNSDQFRAWPANHNQDCTLTYEGSGGGMEAAGTCDIFNRSVKLYNLRHTGFVGDGDTNT